jgi:hypothetical protein
MQPTVSGYRTGTPWPRDSQLYLRSGTDVEVSSQYSLERRLGGPQNRSGQYGEEKIIGRTGTRTPTSRLSSPQPVAVPTALV